MPDVSKHFPWLLALLVAGCSSAEDVPQAVSEAFETAPEEVQRVAPGASREENFQNPAEAIAFYTAEIARNPKDEPAYRQRGNIYSRSEIMARPSPITQPLLN